MNELDRLINELLKLEGIKPEDIHERLKKLAHAQIYQPIFNAGHAVATAQADAAQKAAAARAEKAEDELKEAQKALQKLKDETPDVAKVDREYKDQIAALNKQIKDLEEGHKSEKLNNAVEGAESRLTGLLNARVVPEHVPALLNKATRARLTGVLGDDGKPVVRVLQKGQQIPFAGTEDEQLQALANELVEGVNPLFLRSDIKSGSARDGQSGGSTHLSKKEKFQKIRDKATGKADEKDTAAAPTRRDQLAGRLGMRV